MDKKAHTLVIGLGEIGRPLMEIIQSHEPQAQGLDVAPVDIKGPIGVMHVCYPFDNQHAFIETTKKYVKKFVPQLVIINSTVQPGTTRKIAALANTKAVFSPVRGKHTRMKEELLHYCKFVAGTTKDAVEHACMHFGKVGIKIETLNSPESLELAKLLETTYFGLLIAWAQEMDRMANAVDADYMQMVNFFKEIDYLPRHVFVPGHIGGHCVIPNISILKNHATSMLLDGILDSNERKAKELGLETNKLPQERVAPIKLGDTN